MEDADSNDTKLEEMDMTQEHPRVQEVDKDDTQEEERGEEIGESSSFLLDVDSSMETDDEQPSKYPSIEPCDDHPLRALSCISVACVSESPAAPQPTVPDVYIAVPNGPDVRVEFREKISKDDNRRHNHGSECVPLSAIFHSDANGAQNRWGEEIGYKNWLMHLGRRRRCEILVLVGFLLWIGFFLVLAIVLNGNASKGTNNLVDGSSGVNEVPENVYGNRNRTSRPMNKSSNSSTLVKTRINTPVDTGPTPGSATTISIATSDNSRASSEVANDEPTRNLAQSTTTPNLLTSEAIAMVTDAPNSRSVEANYLIGVGRADITGPAADVNMMGYANPNQVSGGIHLRQYSRAFIVEDPKTTVRGVFVNIDACMASTLLKLEVLKVLKSEFGSLYTAENLCISGTHTHSAPAGFLQDVLFQISSWGYVDETLQAMVDGIVESIKAAHDSMQPGYILLNKGELAGSNINRSPTAYENNPSAEKARYKYNVDTEMTLLKFVNKNGNAIGMINWFPVHCTSMNNTNSLISSDNKGYAEILFERMMDPKALTGHGQFVAAFAQANEGDVSPNTKGPHCIDTGEKCDDNHSTCNGKSQLCVASGPGKDMFESTKIIGRNQYEKAVELYNSATVRIEGPVKFVHQYINMSNYEVVINKTTNATTCKPAMGFSFAAGTTDGPGAFDFKQGDIKGNAFWNFVRNFLHPPSDEQKDCHYPKPILLDTGEMESPYEWQPEVIDTQILQIGQFYMLALPGEFSTMAGRRLRDGVLETLRQHDSEVQYEAVIAGLANAYSDYITTFEEYQIQRYEGASTIYGPHTAQAYNQQYRKLAECLVNGVEPKSSVTPPNNKAILYDLLPGVIFDRAPFFKDFGDVVNDVKDSYFAGDKVNVKFVGANPRNVLHVKSGRNLTFVTIEKQMSDASWKTILTDADWETKFSWIRTSTPAATSDIIISWETGENTEPGTYRISHSGYYKYYLGGIYPYSGTSGVFSIKKA